MHPPIQKLRFGHVLRATGFRTFSVIIARPTRVALGAATALAVDEARPALQRKEELLYLRRVDVDEGGSPKVGESWPLFHLTKYSQCLVW